jgi:predicted Fe-Mo cluster-binding NifX family protein
MKIAIVSNDGVHVADHFGSAHGVLVVDVASDNTMHTQFVAAFGGDLHQQREQGTNLFAPNGPLQGCKAVCCGGMGGHAYESIAHMGMEPIIVGPGAGSWEGVVQAYLAGTLVRHKPHACCHGH